VIVVRSFLIALTFLTRISLFTVKDYREDDFKKSVKFFPLVGGVLGGLYAFFSYILSSNGYVGLSSNIVAIFMIFLMFFLAGGLFFDGFMDTADGIFSGRERERILEIMKDSRVGANAVMAFTLYILFLYAVISELKPNVLPAAMFCAPVISHLTVAVSIKIFPYARKEGIGKMFEDKKGYSSLILPVLMTLLFIVPCGICAIFALIAGLVFTCLFDKYLVKLLGGLTGDTYGATATLAFLLTLVVFLLAQDTFLMQNIYP